MTPQRWERVDRLFQEAVELAPDERRAFLERSCGGDAQLLGEVESLLESDRQDDRAIREAVSQLTPEGPASGERIGPYRIEKLLGAGGMGSVYLATRVDDQYSQQVAIKVAGQGFVADAARFRRERQILATLEHPFIARLLDGGETSSGLPYLVMEYVEGEPITTYARALEMRARVRLFRQVCEAVAYAHHHLVVHRDLKPSNLLVATDGSPRLLDFGIAKLLDANAAVEPQPTMLLCTPEYASPEQVTGDHISTASDIYTLGLLLYELLTGEKAQPITGNSPATVLQAICEREVPDPPKGSVDEDLRSIIRMATRKEASERYASADLLMEDLDRYSEKRPVRARPLTAGYRLRRFVRRNRILAAAAAVITLVLAGGIVSTAYEARRAEHRFAQVRSLAKSVLFDLHDDVMKLSGSTAVREKLVRTVVQYLDELAGSGGDRDLAMELAAAYERAGDVLGSPWSANLGKTREALESYRKAADTYAQISPQDERSRRALSLAYFKFADLLTFSGETAQARERYQEGLSMAAALRDDALLHRGRTFLGDLKIQNGDPHGALADYREALAIAQRLGPRELATSQVRMGDALQECGDLEGAFESYRSALSAASGPRALMGAYLSIGNVLGNPFYLHLGRRNEAEEYYRKALAIAEELSAQDQNNAQGRADVASACWRLGAVTQSAALHERAITLIRGLLESAPRNTGYLRMQVFQLVGLGQALDEARQWRRAKAAFEEALAISRSLAATDPLRAQFLHDQPIALIGLAHVHENESDLAAAQVRYDEALALARSSMTAHRDDLSCHRYVADALEGLARVHAAGGRREEARRCVEQALAIWDDWIAKGVRNPYVMARREDLVRQRM